VVQRRFDFTRLAESALLDDFEVVAGRAPATASDTMTSTSRHAAAATAAADDDDAKRNYHTSPTHYMESISKHAYVFFFLSNI